MVEARKAVELEPRALRNVFGSCPSGVAAVCSLVDECPTGFVVSTLTPVSLEPPLVSICVQRSSETWPVIARSGLHVGISILSAEQEREGRLLATKAGNRFEGIHWTSTAAGAVLIDGAVGWLHCSVYDTLETGDHVTVLLTIEAAHTEGEIEPLVFHASQFRRLGR